MMTPHVLKVTGMHHELKWNFNINLIQNVFKILLTVSILVTRSHSIPITNKKWSESSFINWNPLIVRLWYLHCSPRGNSGNWGLRSCYFRIKKRPLKTNKSCIIWFKANLKTKLKHMGYRPHAPEHQKLDESSNLQ